MINNTEILIKREPLVYTRPRLAVQKKKEKKRIGQYNSNNKLIRGKNTSRYNLHLSHSLFKKNGFFPCVCVFLFLFLFFERTEQDKMNEFPLLYQLS